MVPRDIYRLFMITKHLKIRNMWSFLVFLATPGHGAHNSSSGPVQDADGTHQQWCDDHMARKTCARARQAIAQGSRFYTEVAI